MENYVVLTIIVIGKRISGFCLAKDIDRNSSIIFVFGGAGGVRGTIAMEKPDENYKLIYFNARGRAEQIRFLFAYLDISYQDERIAKEKWSQFKKRTPFGKLPVLEVDGKMISQSNSISRYIAKKYGLVGDNLWEELQCDMLVDTLEDVKQSMTQFHYEQDPIVKEEKKAKLIKETIPYHLKKFDELVRKNEGFVVASKITWADFVLAASLESLETIFGNTALNVYPSLKALKERIFALPAISDWVSKRPTTDN